MCLFLIQKKYTSLLKTKSRYDNEKGYLLIEVDSLFCMVSTLINYAHLQYSKHT